MEVTPKFLVVDSGTTKVVTVQVVDDQGNALSDPLTVLSPTDSSTVKVAVNTTFRQDHPDPLITAYDITGKAPVAQQIILASGKLRDTIQVVVPPVAGYPATFSSATPAIQDTVTVTIGTGFQFLPTATLDFGGTPALIVSQSATQISFVPVPGSTSGPATLSGVAFSSLPAFPLPDLPSGDAITVPAAYTGTDAIATAPTLALPASGASATYLDGNAATASANCLAGPGGGDACLIYQIVLAAPTVFDVSATWEPSATDVGVYFSNAANASAGGGACDSNGRGATASPEACTITLPAGTFYMQVTSYGAFYPQNDPDPTSIAVTFTTH
jgi:hypothetical protein